MNLQNKKISFIFYTEGIVWCDLS